VIETTAVISNDNVIEPGEELSVPTICYQNHGGMPLPKK
jgi:hypothetical protein